MPRGEHRGRPWTREEEQTLRWLYPKKQMTELAERLDRSVYSIMSKCKKMGLNTKGRGGSNRRRLSKEDESWFRSNYPHMSDTICAIRMRCCRKTIINWAKKMGLKKTSEFIHECRVRTGKRNLGVKKTKRAI